MEGSPDFNTESTIGTKSKAMNQLARNYYDQSSDGNLLPGLDDDMALECLSRVSRSDYPSLLFVSKRFNVLINSGDLYKLRSKHSIVEHWVYLACSLMLWEAFDLGRNTWMRLPRMPCDECFYYADKVSLAVGKQLLICGRELTGLAIWMYSLETNKWSRCTKMNVPRSQFGYSSSGKIAIISGGTNSENCVLKCAELYDSELGSWEILPDMIVPRRACSGFFMDGKFYVIGGMSNSMESLTCGEEYNLETRAWRRISHMYPGGYRATQSYPMVAVVNNQLYAADECTNEVRKYDKSNNTWNVITKLPDRPSSSIGWDLAFKASGDKLLVISGHRRPQGEVIVMHTWCPEDGKSSEDDWDVLSVREQRGTNVLNCAIMGW